MNWASLTGKLGAPNAQISKAYPSPVTPAGFAFSHCVQKDMAC